MDIILYPQKSDWKQLLERPHFDQSDLFGLVRQVLADIQAKGDAAIKAYEQKFDHVELTSLQVSRAEFEEAEAATPEALKEAINRAMRNIQTFHRSQLHQLPKVETCPGVECWQKAMPIEKVGLYIPGGTAPLFSTVLMLAVPAKLAGCEQIVLCTPPNAAGKVHPTVLYAAQAAGVTSVFKIGGVQAIGAMAYGTESIPKVYKIFGPGNQYVMAAKQEVSLHDVAIDMPAGPSEVCVVADDSSRPDFVAADLLSQAEHGPDSQSVLITTSQRLLEEVKTELASQLAALPRRAIAEQSLANSLMILVHDTDEAIRLSNVYAPEHLILCTADYERLSLRVVNAGSVFLGNYACESAGDYASGTNHTLPTHGYALAYNGVNLDSFCRKITFQHLTAEGVRQIGHAVEVMAEHEQLMGHKNAMTLRMNEVTKTKAE